MGEVYRARDARLARDVAFPWLNAGCETHASLAIYRVPRDPRFVLCAPIRALCEVLIAWVFLHEPSVSRHHLLSAFLLFQVHSLLMGRYILPWFVAHAAVWGVCLLFFQSVLLAGYSLCPLAWIAEERGVGAHRAACRLVATVALSHPTPSGNRIRAASQPRTSCCLCSLAWGGPYFILSLDHGRCYSAGTVSREQGRPAGACTRSPTSDRPRPLQLSVPNGALRAPAHTKLDLVVVVRRVRGAVRIHRLASSHHAPHRNRDQRERLILKRVHRPSPSYSWLTPRRHRVHLVDRDHESGSRRTSSARPSCGSSRSRSTSSASFSRLKATAGTARMLFAILAGILAPVAAAATGAGVLSAPFGAKPPIYLAAIVRCLHALPRRAEALPAWPRYLTAFYLTVSAGGVIGGVFVALIAPQVFREFTEYPLGLTAACNTRTHLVGCTPALTPNGRAAYFSIRIPLMAMIFGALGAASLAALPGSVKGVQTVVRNFFGILWVVDRHDVAGDLSPS